MTDLTHRRQPGAMTKLTEKDEDAVTAQAEAWVVRLASGMATTEDAEALRRWRNESPTHRRAFAEAKLLWESLGPASEIAKSRLSLPDVAGNIGPSRILTRRRALIGGALAASAAGLAYAGSQPPLRLWPSMNELRADYRTRKGEQRRLALWDDLSLVLNTQTSISVRPAAGTAGRGLELIEGEAAFSANARESRPVEVYAAEGSASATLARFDMRREGASVSVTCIAGTVTVKRHGDVVSVSAGNRAIYDERGLREGAPVDAATAGAWQNGQLIFRHQPLSSVIDEINRYRPGRILLIDEKLGRRDVVATFHLDRIEEAVAHLARAFDARTRLLPGGVILMG